MIVMTTESILRWQALISSKLTFIIDTIIIIIMMSIVGVKVIIIHAIHGFVMVTAIIIAYIPRKRAQQMSQQMCAGKSD